MAPGTLPRLLVFASIYLPGYKAGGPIRSIANLVEQLGSEFQFSILTADRDLGDEQPYPGIEKQVWHPVGNARVRYLSPRERRPLAWRRLLRSLEYDAFYLNSVFDPCSVLTLWLRRLGQLPNRPIILAPRGEFSQGALALKAYKKQTYLRLAAASQLWRGLLWQASSEFELSDIQRLVWPRPRVIVSPPLVSATPPALHASAASAQPTCREKQAGQLRVVFLSRISPMKNLEWALNSLAGMAGDIQFDIYGPIEETSYWRKCESLLAGLGPRVRANYCGVVPANRVPEVLSRYHLFLFPTLGENFGHVIAEALAAGCPVLISDQTPWRDLQKLGIGWDLPLTDVLAWRRVINQCVAMDQAQFDQWSVRAHDYMASTQLEREQEALQAYRLLFHGALQPQTA